MVEDAKGPRKLIEFDASTLQALELLGRDSMRDLQELADEAFRDLLKKHGRPSSLKEALRQSTRQMPANDQATRPRAQDEVMGARAPTRPAPGFGTRAIRR